MGYGIFGEKITGIWDIKTPLIGASEIVLKTAMIREVNSTEIDSLLSYFL